MHAAWRCQSQWQRWIPATVGTVTRSVWLLYSTEGSILIPEYTYYTTWEIKTIYMFTFHRTSFYLRTILFGVLAVVLTLRHLNQFRLLTNYKPLCVICEKSVSAVPHDKNSCRCTWNKYIVKNIAKVVKLTGDLSFSVDLHIRLGKLQVQHFGHFGHVCQW